MLHIESIDCVMGDRIAWTRQEQTDTDFILLAVGIRDNGPHVKSSHMKWKFLWKPHPNEYDIQKIRTPFHN
jgi:hypothetical protein